MANLRLINPWSMWPSMLEDTDTFMGSFGVMPKTAMYEKDNKVVVELDAPGFTKEDITISITGDILKVTGKASEKKEEKEGRKYFLSEVSERSFTRSISLPYEVKVESTKATYKDGVLTLEMPKSEKVLPKTVQIEAS